MDEKERASYVKTLRAVADMYTARGDKDYYVNLADTLERGDDIMNLKEIMVHAQLTLQGFTEEGDGVRHQ